MTKTSNQIINVQVIMRWIAHDGGNHQRTFIELNKAKL